MISVSSFYCCKKGAYPDEYMEDLEKLSQTSLSKGFRKINMIHTLKAIHYY